MKLRNISDDVQWLPLPYLGRQVDVDEVVDVDDQYGDPALYAWSEATWKVEDDSGVTARLAAERAAARDQARARYEAMRVEDLKAELDGRDGDLATTGNKDELVARLLADDDTKDGA